MELLKRELLDIFEYLSKLPEVMLRYGTNTVRDSFLDLLRNERAEIERANIAVSKDAAASGSKIGIWQLMDRLNDRSCAS
jgi:hypothetical protein